VRGALRLLRPGGKLLITTPDRDGFDPGDRWRTDPPPVHFHWFGRRSMEVIADRLGVDVELLDFTDFNEAHVQAVPRACADLPTPFLDADLAPLAVAGGRERVIDLLDRAPRLSAPLRAVARGRQGERRRGRGSAALAAVFSVT
jgi:SAM-dependent methyltransferase